MRLTIIGLFFLLGGFQTYSQHCRTTLYVQLTYSKGNHTGQTVRISTSSGTKVDEKTSDKNGIAEFDLPCSSYFIITVSNYPRKREIRTANADGAETTVVLTFEPNAVEKEASFAMNAQEQQEVDKAVADFPDSTYIMPSDRMPRPTLYPNYSNVILYVRDFDDRPLAGEWIRLVGQKRKKVVVGTSDAQGKLSVWLPKGDQYSVNFKYKPNFSSTEVPYTKGTSTISLTFSYLGSKEIERRKRIEELRIATEEKRIKEEEKRFEAKCRKLGISKEEGRRKELSDFVESISQTPDTVILAALNRNKWTNKLIVCDVTGSMSSYVAQLSFWFQLRMQREKNLQFVFFNDGDDKSDDQKKIGKTGGIYYSAAKNLNELDSAIIKATSAGYGGDCPENNMEALIEGVKLAAQFKELIMIADNRSPVRDIELLKNFSIPVHVIACGVDPDILPDYLLIAWKTKGSVHTIEEDITSLANLMEGQEVKINSIRYRISGGEFVRVDKK